MRKYRRYYVDTLRMNMVGSMIDRSKLLKFLWTKTFKTNVHMLNQISIEVVHKTSFRLWKGWKPNLGHVHVWGWSSKVRFDNTKGRKLDQSAVQLSISLDMPKCPNNVDFSQQILRFVEQEIRNFLRMTWLLRAI